MNVLVIAPHPDDESIGPGGSIRLRADRGDRVVVVFLTSGEQGLNGLPIEVARGTREEEANRACGVLGVAHCVFLRLPDWTLNEHVSSAVAQLLPILESERPQQIFVPHRDEWHPDHQAALSAVIAAVRDARVNSGMPLPWLLGYEVWTPLRTFDHVEDISLVMHAKLAAIRCHSTQLTGFRYDQSARGLARYRGALAARVRFAEVFSSIDGSTVCDATG